MKKWKFSINYLFTETCTEVVVLQQKAKGFLTMLAGATYIAANAEYALVVGLLSVVGDTLLSCLDYVEEEVKTEVIKVENTIKDVEQKL